MRIALLTAVDIRIPGGVTHSMFRIANSLQKFCGVEVDVIYLNVNVKQDLSDAPDGIKEVEYINSIKVFEVNSYMTGDIETNRKTELFYALKRLVDGNKYELLHAFYVSSTGFVAALIASFLNIKSLVSVRGNDLLQQMWDASKFSQIKWALDNATYVTTVTDESTALVRLISSQENVATVLNSIDESIFSNTFPSHLQDLKDKMSTYPIIGIHGTVKHKKGIPFILKTFYFIKKRYPEAKLLIIGSIGFRDAPEFRDIAKKLAILDSIYLSGFVEHKYILQIIKSFDLLLYPSLHDGCPNAILEAMLAKVPIVALDSGAISQLFGEQLTSYIEREFNVDLFTAKALHILSMEDKTLLTTLAYNRIKTYFTPEIEANNYFNIYKKILS